MLNLQCRASRYSGVQDKGQAHRTRKMHSVETVSVSPSQRPCPGGVRVAATGSGLPVCRCEGGQREPGLGLPKDETVVCVKKPSTDSVHILTGAIVPSPGSPQAGPRTHRRCVRPTVRGRN
jgi:hypothetical protein